MEIGGKSCVCEGGGGEGRVVVQIPYRIIRVTLGADPEFELKRKGW